MALLAPSQPAENDSNEFSDEFGEDFSIDELAVIDHLLVQATNEVAAPPLAIADLGDYEGAHPYSAIWPRFRKTSQGEKRNNGDRGRDGVAEAASVPRVKVQYEYEDNELSVKDWIGVSAGSNTLSSTHCISNNRRKKTRANPLTNIPAPSLRSYR